MTETLETLPFSDNVNHLAEFMRRIGALRWRYHGNDKDVLAFYFKKGHWAIRVDDFKSMSLDRLTLVVGTLRKDVR